MNEIVSVEWLNQNIEDENLIVLDASINKITNQDSVVSTDKTIPNSLFFDLKNNFSDTESYLPNTIPSPEQFQMECRKLGINNSSKIVVYDNLGVYSSPRVWWLFKVMGHNNISVLDGGLTEWEKHNFKIEVRQLNQIKTGDFTANFNQDFLFEFTQVVENLETKNQLIVDARSSGRFSGTEVEPRENLKSGHISDSINVPFGDVLRDVKFKSKEELVVLFGEKIQEQKELVFSCGSGLTASIVMLAYRIAMGRDSKIYDGSWTEWAERQKLFV